MKNHIKNTLQWLLQHALTVFSCVAIIVLCMAAIAYATTIGTNITTGGTLSVSSNSTLATTTISGGDLIVDTNTLIVDNDNNYVGIGTTSPAYLLDVYGDLRIGKIGSAYDNTLYVNTSNGRVGIGTSSPYKTLSVAGDMAISGNTTLATTTLSGDLDLSLKQLKNAVLENLSDFPSNPAEGQMFWSTASSTPYWYDETNSRWKGDVSGATFVVAASNSRNKEKADYVCDGTDDQVEIQAAIDALPSSGGSVRLTEGLYVKNSATGISVPSNVGIFLDEGATIKFADDINDDACIFKNEDQTNGNSNIIIQGGILDGNRANQSSGEQNIIEFIKVESSKVDVLMKNACSQYVKMSGCVGVEIINRQYPLSKEIGEFITEQEINLPDILYDELESGWTLTNATYDTTKYYSGNGSIKFTTFDGWSSIAQAKKTLSPARDFSRATFCAAVNLGDSSSTEHWYQHIALWAPDSANRVEYQLNPGSWFHLKNTWFVVPFSNKTEYGNPDLRNVTKIEIWVFAESGQTATTWLDKLFLTHSSLGKGLVTFSWDDGFDDGFDVYAPVFDKYGYRAVAGINPGSIGNSGKMTISELKTLQSKGWDIVNHGWAHVIVSGETEAVVEDDVRKGQDWLIQNGFQKGARFYIYPGAQTDEIGYEVVKKYHLMARTVQDSGQMNTFPFFQRGLIFTIAMGERTLDQLKARIDQAFQRGLWLNLYGHTTADTTEADLDNLLSYINDKGMPVVTFSDVWDKYMRVPIGMSVMSEHFPNLQTASTTYVHAAITGTGASQDITTNISNPDVPRNISITVTNNAAPSGNVTITGIDAKGNSVTEDITVSAGTNAYGNKAFTTVSKITIPAGVSSSDTVTVGISDKLGLSNIVYKTGDVYKLTRNGADVSVGTVDTANGTVDCATITGSDDLTIYYRSNLNIIQ